ncbi:MAG: M4 family metallopeptidase [Saprospiraceae bacterium]
MNRKFIFLFVTSLLMFTDIAVGQLKNILPDKGDKDGKTILKELLDQKKLVQNSEQNAKELNLRSISPIQLLAYKSDLKPGIINENNVPAYIEGSLQNAGKRGMGIDALAMEYLEAAAPLMQIKNPDSEFVIKSIDTDQLNMTHVKMNQLYKGVPLYGAEIIVHSDRQKVNFLNGRYYPTPELENVTPAIDQNKSVEYVKTDLGDIIAYQNEISAAGNLSPISQLVLYRHHDQWVLAYHVTVYKNLIDRWEYFVNASDGEIVHKFSSICRFHNHNNNSGSTCTHHQESKMNNSTSASVLLDGKAVATSADLFNINRQINTYEVSSKFYLIDGSRDIFATVPTKLPNDPNGVIWTIDAFNTSPEKDNFRYDHVTSTNNIWNNKTAVSAHYNGGKSFEYFRNVHNRKSINGTGGNIISLINIVEKDGSSMGNAFWNGQAMFYGNGDNDFLPLARGLDVAGHEMTHGVVQSTANLEYEGESGALNESFADVFGAMIDRDDWKIGEDVVKTTAFPSGALRSLDDPYNGATTNNFNAGWQPKLYTERYKGAEDNGGVHINSGIPNFAFYKFATAIGKDKAEKVYYRALEKYLTKSSQFIDCRIAVVKATTDLYGNTEISAANKAFDEVGIIGNTGGNYQTDVSVNPGQEFILAVGPDDTGIYIYQTDGKELAKISSKKIIRKPSISDDGSIVVYVGTDNKIYFTTIDWANNKFSADQVFDSRALWYNAVISKDGSKIAAIYDDDKTIINVYDVTSQAESDFELYNPTFTEGVKTGDVLEADAMEFDPTGEFIMYDAQNEIKSVSTASITYWDIGFIKVWNKTSNTFSLGKVDKLFTSLPKGISVGFPTFSKNSPYIIALDYIDFSSGTGNFGDNTEVLAANIETGAVNLISKTNTFGVPSYSSKDNKMIFSKKGTSALNVDIIDLKSSKIEPNGSSGIFITNRQWATWFSNGKRILSDNNDIVSDENGLKILQNPVNQLLEVEMNFADTKDGVLRIIDASGKTHHTRHIDAQDSNTRIQINTSALLPGTYFISFLGGKTVKTLTFVKI